MTTDKPNVLYTASGDEVIIASRRPYWFWAKHLAISIIGTATLLPIIAYLGQTYLENQLNASNERLKTDLSREWRNESVKINALVEIQSSAVGLKIALAKLHQLLSSPERINDPKYSNVGELVNEHYESFTMIVGQNTPFISQRLEYLSNHYGESLISFCASLNAKPINLEQINQSLSVLSEAQIDFQEHLQNELRSMVIDPQE